MPVREVIKNVLVIGSGPIVIGQAAEFDYAGTQACKALREEGLQVVLINSNPATIMTDSNIADVVYIEPLKWDIIERIIDKERPDGLIAGLGGQTGLNMAVELADRGILDKYGVRLLGTPLEAIQRAEDREMFKKTMFEIGEPVPESAIVNTMEEALSFSREAGYPLIVRPAYTLGGTGGGVCHNENELVMTATKGFKSSMIHQLLLERSVLGWKEIEYEVMRDGCDNCITVCNMENIDPCGIHTGDSIVVAPTQTLTDEECQMLRNSAMKIIRALQIEGGCNVQFALHPTSLQYVVIEVNPRVSRSSALASKATGYPIAKMTAKIAAGLTLPEIINPVTGNTPACFEPTIDYVVIKVPRWPFDKFVTADRVLGTQMKATGEVMAIDRSFEAALLKAMRSLEIGVDSLQMKGLPQLTDMQIEHRLQFGDDERIFIIAEALRRSMTLREIHQLTKIEYFFLQKIKNIVDWEHKIRSTGSINDADLIQVKRLGFSDSRLAQLLQISEQGLRERRKAAGIVPVYKMVDTCAGEYAAQTPYYYSTYDYEDESVRSERKKVIVLGSGPIRIGQGIEFDYCSVHSVWGLAEENVETIIINNNPETVSTDFDTSDKLYFEPLTLEDVLNVVDKEQPLGVVVQFGGQTAINLAGELQEAGVNILGTPVDCIDLAEDREKFEQLLKELEVPQTEGRTVTAVAQAQQVAEELGYPVLVRPSYVLGGRAMELVYDTPQLLKYMEQAVQVSPKHPVLIDKYVRGKEVEVDAIGDGENLLMPGIMEHVERAGVHSGDSIAVYPPQTLNRSEIDMIIAYTTKIARALKIKGLINIQYVVDRQGQVYVIEVNPRASRTVPILSKVTGVPMVRTATRAMLGKSLQQLGYQPGLWPQSNYITVKAPVFSFEKLGLVDISLGPEMKSTGEVMGVDKTFAHALYKAMIASGLRIEKTGAVLVSVADKDKEEVIPIVKAYSDLDFEIIATEETARTLQAAGIVTINAVNPVQQIRDGRISLVINTPTKGKAPERKGFRIRRMASELKVPCLTSLDTAQALVEVLKCLRSGEQAECLSMDEFTAFIDKE